jgi:hypothetical protein
MNNLSLLFLVAVVVAACCCLSHFNASLGLSLLCLEVNGVGALLCVAEKLAQEEVEM